MDERKDDKKKANAEEPARVPHTPEENEAARKQADGVPKSYAGDDQPDESPFGSSGSGGTGGG